MGADENTAISQLAAEVGATWPCIAAAEAAAKAMRTKLEAALGQAKLVDSDCAVVVFGSLARGELTAGSDVDWTLLVDGAANPQHLLSSQGIAAEIAEIGAKKPGPTGVFGAMTFSHDLIHRIGGDVDDNQNTTRRVLLLLESRAVAGQPGVRERVLRHIIRRYIEEDLASDHLHPRVPRFLLNDIVRYWRTMCVDYAAKRRERAAHGWALRNFKLRMSRKLIFAAGLTTCLKCELRPSEVASSAAARSDSDGYREAIVNDVLASANRSPLQTVARLALDLSWQAGARVLFDQYEAFLSLIGDTTKRKELDDLGPDEAVTNQCFRNARDVGRRFDEALRALFFSSNDNLTNLTQRYGVF